MESLNPKIAIIGAGNVGSTFAFSLMISGLAREIVLVDKNELLAKGECMDLNHGLSFAHPTKIYAAGFEGCEDTDIVVITAGANRKPGQSRTDLVKENVEIFKDLIPAIIKYSGNAILLIVTNPVDILTYVTLKISCLPPGRVIGSGTVLDTARLKYVISEYSKADPGNIHAYIIGEHGDTELPIWSNATIWGMEIGDYCSVYARHSNAKNELDKHDHPDESHNSDNESQPDIKYKCPMKCERDKTYDAPGHCPVCNMKLILVDDKNQDTKDHHAPLPE